MRIALVVAMTKNRVIGRDGGLPWRLSSDLKRFKAITMGKPVIMGRRTWESIGRPLPGRLNIIVTRNRDFRPEGTLTVTSLEAAIEAAGREGSEEVAVIGGGEIFEEALARADVLHVTHIETDLEGDVLFPPIDEAVWRPVSEETVPAGPKDEYPTRYALYRRRNR